MEGCAVDELTATVDVVIVGFDSLIGPGVDASEVIEDLFGEFLADDDLDDWRRVGAIWIGCATDQQIHQGTAIAGVTRAGDIVFGIGPEQFLRFSPDGLCERSARDRIESELADDGAIGVGSVGEAATGLLLLGKLAVRIGRIEPVGNDAFEVFEVERLGVLDELVLVLLKLIVAAEVVDPSEEFDVFARQDSGEVGVGKDGEVIKPRAKPLVFADDGCVGMRRGGHARRGPGTRLGSDVCLLG
ncbi:MAG: hypothetical protein R2706_15485 [Acidimicrobiales bacterium]